MIVPVTSVGPQSGGVTQLNAFGNKFSMNADVTSVKNPNGQSAGGTGVSSMDEITGLTAKTNKIARVNNLPRDVNG